MAKHRWHVILLILVIGAAGLRIWSVNRGIPSVEAQTFEPGEEVSLGRGIDDEKDQKMEGYTIQVEETELVTADEFCERYAIDTETLESEMHEYYYLVTADFHNHNAEDDNSYGVDLYNIDLLGITSYVLLDREAFLAANPGLSGSSFALRGNTEMTMIIPYGIDSGGGHVRIEEVQKGNMKLLVTEYPLRKIIQL